MNFGAIIIYSSLFDDKEVKRMSKVKNQFGKQHHQDAELRTQNHKTHDVEPKTLDPKPETDSLLGPNFRFRSPVLSFESWGFTSKDELAKHKTLDPGPDKFTFAPVRAPEKVNKTLDGGPKTLVWALMEANSKPSRKETKQLWPEAKEIVEFLGRHLPKQRLIKALTILSNARKRRFLRSRIPKYGSLNKGRGRASQIHEHSGGSQSRTPFHIPGSPRPENQ
jgi:hypothetical protein